MAEKNHHPIRKAFVKAARLPLCTMALAVLSAPASASELGYLQSLLNATPGGGWVMASSNRFSDAWATGSDALPDGSYTNPGSVVRAWSSFAWDSTRGNLLLWGGGHANYMGNEMYVWQGADGSWTRGSLSSRVERVGASSTYLVVDDAAPQSAHTYDNNIYLPVNDMFLTFGGASFNTGAGFQVRNGSGDIVRAGPWMWDPTKADANKVGGSTGSGYDVSTPGGSMWLNRQGQTTGTEGRGYLQGTTAYRQENGQDVVYLTVEAESSGWPALYRYAVGDVRQGGLDAWERVGVSWNAPSGQNVAAIDSAHGLYVHTSAVNGFSSDLGVWDLAQNNAADPGANRDQAVQLTLADGTPFLMNTDFGMAYDEAAGKFLLWDGHDLGSVWSTEAAFDASGALASTWIVTALASTTGAQPGGNFATGVLGKWEYVTELGAFIALNAYDAAAGDAEVWLYKPFANAVPEPSVYALLLSGLAVLGWRARRHGRG